MMRTLILSLCCILFLSLGLFTAVQAKDGRWIDTAGFTGKVSAVFFFCEQ